MFLTKLILVNGYLLLKNIFFLYIILHSSKKDGADSMKLSEKTNTSLRLDRNMYVCGDVCSIYSANYE